MTVASWRLTLLSSPVVVLLCAMLSTGLTLLIIKLAHWRDWLVYPRSDRWSARAVAKFGGLAIILSFLLTALLLPLSPKTVRLTLLTTAMAGIGFWDDLRTLPPRIKLLSQLTLACLAVYCGFVYPLNSNSAINIAFTIFWIIGITNAFNLLDNMDGLAAGVGIITVGACFWRYRERCLAT
jgi:UDP-GlcNAc:undecaprenyl-phosphate GlcNAc-1-phosphate transferase